MGTPVEEPTGVVFTVKVALVALPGTVTLAGTLATPGLLLDRLTTAPPLGAGALSVTVPVEELPPVTLDGLRLSAESVGGRSEEHTSELQSRGHLVCRLLLEKKKKNR